MKNQNLCQNEIEALKVTKESFTQELYLYVKDAFEGEITLCEEGILVKLPCGKSFTVIVKE